MAIVKFSQTNVFMINSPPWMGREQTLITPIPSLPLSKTIKYCSASIESMHGGN